MAAGEDLRKHLHATADGLRADYKKSGGYRHRGGRGDIREHFLNEWLAGFLPSTLRVTKGEIADSYGTRTPEFDCIIYLPSPIPNLFHEADRRVVPVEEVLCVLEYKTTLEPGHIGEFSKKLDALGGLVRHFELPPTEVQIQRILSSKPRATQMAVPAGKQLQIIRPIAGALVAFESAAPDTVVKYFGPTMSPLLEVVYSFSEAVWARLPGAPSLVSALGPDAFVMFVQMLLLMVDHRNYWSRVVPDAHRYMMAALGAAARDEIEKVFKAAK